MDRYNSMFNVLMYWIDKTYPARIYPEQDVCQYTLPFRRQVATAVYSRQFFIGQRENPGLAPIDAQEGDVVGVLFGCAVPVLLRPEGDHYLLVGEVFVHGFMNGEAIELKEKGELEVRNFVMH
jgi:hypothetical protein